MNKAIHVMIVTGIVFVIGAIIELIFPGNQVFDLIKNICIPSIFVSLGYYFGSIRLIKTKDGLTLEKENE